MALSLIINILIFALAARFIIWTIIQHVLRVKAGIEFSRFGWLCVKGVRWTSKKVKRDLSKDHYAEISVSLTIERIGLAFARTVSDGDPVRFLRLSLDVPKALVLVSVKPRRGSSKSSPESVRSAEASTTQGSDPNESVQGDLEGEPAGETKQQSDSRNRLRSGPSRIFFAAHITNFLKNLISYVLVRWLTLAINSLSVETQVNFAGKKAHLSADLSSVELTSSCLAPNHQVSPQTKQKKGKRRKSGLPYDDSATYYLVLCPFKVMHGDGDVSSPILNAPNGLRVNYKFPMSTAWGAEESTVEMAEGKTRSIKDLSGRTWSQKLHRKRTHRVVPSLTVQLEEVLMTCEPLLATLQMFHSVIEGILEHPCDRPPSRALSGTTRASNESSDSSLSSDRVISSGSGGDESNLDASAVSYIKAGSAASFRFLPPPETVSIDSTKTVVDLLEGWSLNISDIDVSVQLRGLRKARENTGFMSDLWLTHYAHALLEESSEEWLVNGNFLARLPNAENKSSPSSSEDLIASLLSPQNPSSTSASELHLPAREKAQPSPPFDQQRNGRSSAWTLLSGIQPLSKETPPGPLMQYFHLRFSEATVSFNEDVVIQITRPSVLMGIPPPYRIETDDSDSDLAMDQEALSNINTEVHEEWAESDSRPPRRRGAFRSTKSATPYLKSRTPLDNMLATPRQSILAGRSPGSTGGPEMPGSRTLQSFTAFHRVHIKLGTSEIDSMEKLSVHQGLQFLFEVQRSIKNRSKPKAHSFEPMKVPFDHKHRIQGDKAFFDLSFSPVTQSVDSQVLKTIRDCLDSLMSKLRPSKQSQKTIDMCITGIDSEVRLSPRLRRAGFNLGSLSLWKMNVNRTSFSLKARRKEAFMKVVSQKLASVQVIGRVWGGLSLLADNDRDAAETSGIMMHYLRRIQSLRPSKTQQTANGFSIPFAVKTDIAIDSLRLQVMGSPHQQFLSTESNCGIEGFCKQLSIRLDYKPPTNKGGSKEISLRSRRRKLPADQQGLQLELLIQKLRITAPDRELVPLIECYSVGSMLTIRSSDGQLTNAADCKVRIKGSPTVNIAYSAPLHYHVCTVFRVLRATLKVTRLFKKKLSSTDSSKSHSTVRSLISTISSFASSCKVDPIKLTVALPQQLTMFNGEAQLDEKEYGTLSLICLTDSSVGLKTMFSNGERQKSMKMSLQTRCVRMWGCQKGIPEDQRLFLRKPTKLDESSCWTWHDAVKVASQMLMIKLPSIIERERDLERLLGKLCGISIEYVHYPNRDFSILLEDGAELHFSQELPFAVCVDGLANFVKVLQQTTKIGPYSDPYRMASIPPSPNLQSPLRDLPRVLSSRSVRVPKFPLNLKIPKSLTVIFHNSNFEAKLDRIWRLGASEQMARLARESAFWRKVSQMEEADRLAGLPDVGYDYEGLMHELKAYHSSSWIRQIRNAWAEDLASIQMDPPTGEVDYNDPNICIARPLIRWTFENIELAARLPLLPQTPLQVDPTVRLPSDTKRSPGYDELRKALHLLDPSGTPVDTDFSLIIGTYVDLRLKQFQWRFRDHPLPFMSFGDDPVIHTPPPYPPASDHVSTAIPGLKQPVRLHGLLFLTASQPCKESIRQLPIRLTSYLSPLVICKTLLPIKIYMRSLLDFNPETTCFMQVGPSVSPSMQDYGRVMENVAKPNQDPSKPLAWWDKIRLLCHGRLHLRFLERPGTPSARRRILSNRVRAMAFGDLPRPSAAQQNYRHSEFILRLTGTWNPYYNSICGGGCYGIDLVFRGLHIEFGGVDPNSSMLVSSKTFKWSSMANKGHFEGLENMGPVVPVLAHCSSALIRLPEDRITRSLDPLTTDGVRWKLGDTAVRLQEDGMVRIMIFLLFEGAHKSHSQVCTRIPAYHNSEDSFKGFRSDSFHVALGVSMVRGTSAPPTPSSSGEDVLSQTSSHALRGQQANDGSSVFVYAKMINQLSQFVAYERLYRAVNLRGRDLFSPQLSNFTGGLFQRSRYQRSASPKAFAVQKEKLLGNLKTFDFRTMLPRLQLTYLHETLAPLEIRDAVGLKVKAKWSGMMYKAMRDLKGFHTLIHEVEVAEIECQIVEALDPTSHSAHNMYMNNFRSDGGLPDDTMAMWTRPFVRWSQNYGINEHIASNDHWTHDGREMVSIRIGDRLVPLPIQCRTFVWTPNLMYFKKADVESAGLTDAKMKRYVNAVSRVQQDIFSKRLDYVVERSDLMETILRLHEKQLMEEGVAANENEDLQLAYKKAVDQVAHLYSQRVAIEARLSALRGSDSSDDASVKHFGDGKHIRSSILRTVQNFQDFDDSMSDAETENQNPSSDVLAEDHPGYIHHVVVHNAMLLWNEDVRNVVYRCLDLLNQDRLSRFYTSNRAMEYLSSLMGRDKKAAGGNMDVVDPDKNTSDVSFTTDGSELGGWEDESEERRFSKISLDLKDDGNPDTIIAKEMLDKLLSEMDENHVVVDSLNRTPDRTRSGSNAAASETAQKPHSQDNYLAIWNDKAPEGYMVEKDVVVRFINPQIKMECFSEPEEDGGSVGNLIVSAESMVTTTRNLLMGEFQVKKLLAVKLEDAQFSMAVFDRQSSSSDNPETWLPIECIIDPTAAHIGFKRLVDRTSAVWYNHTVSPLYHQKVNPLDTGIAGLIHDHEHPLLEDKTDFWHLKFSNFHVSADSLSFQVLMAIVRQLLVYREPRQRKRLEQFETILFAAQLEDIMVLVERVHQLREEIRALTFALSYDSTYLRDVRSTEVPMMDAPETDDPNWKWVLILKRCQEAQEELSTVMNVLKRVLSKRSSDLSGRGSREKVVRQKATITAEEVVWILLNDHAVPFVKAMMRSARFSLTDFEDQTKVNNFEVSDMEIRNEMSHAIYKEALAPYATKLADGKERHMPSNSKLLRVYWNEKPPVAGIPVLEHFEVNLAPLLIQLTYDLARHTMAYIFPNSQSTSSQQNKSVAVASQPVVFAGTRRAVKDIDGTRTGPNVANAKETTPPAERATTKQSATNVRPPPSRRLGGLMRHRASSRLIGGNQSAKQANEAEETTNKRHSAGSVYADSVVNTSPADTSDGPLATAKYDDDMDTAMGSTEPPSMKSSKSGKHRTTSTKHEPRSNASNHALPTAAATSGTMETVDPLAQMKTRASDNKTFIYIKVPGAQHCFSYRGGKEKNFEDLHQFVFKLPTLEYRNKTCSWVELIGDIKWDFIKSVAFSHTGSLMREMFWGGKSRHGSVSASSTHTGTAAVKDDGFDSKAAGEMGSIRSGISQSISSTQINGGLFSMMRSAPHRRHASESASLGSRQLVHSRQALNRDGTIGDSDISLDEDSNNTSWIDSGAASPATPAAARSRSNTRKTFTRLRFGRTHAGSAPLRKDNNSAQDQRSIPAPSLPPPNPPSGSLVKRHSAGMVPSHSLTRLASMDLIPLEVINDGESTIDSSFAEGRKLEESIE